MECERLPRRRRRFVSKQPRSSMKKEKHSIIISHSPCNRCACSRRNATPQRISSPDMCFDNPENDEFDLPEKNYSLNVPLSLSEHPPACTLTNPCTPPNTSDNVADAVLSFQPTQSDMSIVNDVGVTDGSARRISADALRGHGVFPLASIHVIPCHFGNRSLLDPADLSSKLPANPKRVSVTASLKSHTEHRWWEQWRLHHLSLPTKRASPPLLNHPINGSARSKIVEHPFQHRQPLHEHLVRIGAVHKHNNTQHTTNHVVTPTEKDEEMVLSLSHIINQLEHFTLLYYFVTIAIIIAHKQVYSNHLNYYCSHSFIIHTSHLFLFLSSCFHDSRKSCISEHAR